jgi:hypothetical protein
MNSGMGGYGRINYQGALPVGGGATASNSVGAMIQQLMRMGSMPGGKQMPQQTDPQAELEMAKALGLVGGGGVASRGDQVASLPMEDWLTSQRAAGRNQAMFGYGRDTR